MGIFDRKKRTITAAHTIVHTNDGKARKNLITSRNNHWQQKTLLYADAIPEVGAAGSFVRNTISRVKFNIEIPGAEENETLKRTQDALTEWVNELNPGRAAEHVFYIGETVIGYETEGENVHWRTYATEEISVNDKTGQIEIRQDDGEFAPAPPELKLFKVFYPDRLNRFDAWSNHKGIIDVLEALFLHQLVDIAIAQSRLAGSGILLIPDDDFEVAHPDENGIYPDGSLGSIMQDIAQSMIASIRNRTANEAFVPYMLATSRESVDKFKHFMLERTDDARAYETRIDAYRKRYASGIDLPPEIVLGITDANHWTSWKVDENTWSYHLEPLANMIGEAIKQNFVEPVARNMGYDGPLTIKADGSNVVAKPDKTEVVLTLAKQDRLTNEGIAELLDIPAEYVKDPENPDDTITLDDLSIGTRQTPPTQASITAALKKKISDIPDRYDAQNTRYLKRIENLLIKHIPGLIKTRFEQITAQTFDEQFDALLQDARNLSQSDINTRISIIESALGVTRGTLLDRYQQEVTTRTDRMAALMATYVNYVANEQRVNNQSRQGDKIPRNAIKSKYAPHTGLLRALVDIQQGGTGEVNETFMELNVRPADVNTDRIINEPLDDAGIERTPIYVWVYGDEASRFQPFPPHRALDGVAWRKAQETTELDNDGLTEAGVWHPGDHVGCQCGYDIIWQ